MPVPSNISELSTTPANNSPAGTETPGTADDYLRTLAAFIATLSAADSAHVAASDPHPAYALESDVSATLANYAPKASPALTGVPTAPTATAGTNTKQIATTEFVQTSVTGVSTTFASSAENAAGTVENKAVDPLGIREAFNAYGSAPVYACRAWVNFNGTGTVSIRASGNVSSITDNGTGDYTVNFATAMPTAYYSVAGRAVRETGNTTAIFTSPTNSGATPTTSSIKVGSVLLGGTVANTDCEYMSVAIFC